VSRLHDLMEKRFPACRTNHTKAALKAHTIMSMRGVGEQSFKVTAEREHDGPVFCVGPWVRDHLLMFDLGYFRYPCIGRNGATSSPCASPLLDPPERWPRHERRAMSEGGLAMRPRPTRTGGRGLRPAVGPDGGGTCRAQFHGAGHRRVLLDAEMRPIPVVVGQVLAEQSP
jgi:hypothetical protein